MTQHRPCPLAAPSPSHPPHRLPPPAPLLGRLCCRGLLLFWMAGALLLPGQASYAHKRAFVWSYEWFTPAVGEDEVELWATTRDHGSTWEKRLEYEFATSPRHALGLYLVSGEGSAASIAVEGWRVESRYRFGEFRSDRWLHASYLEVSKERGEPYELEGKWLLSRYNPRDDAMVINLIAEKELTSDAGVEPGYSLGWSRRVSDRTRLGVESFGEFRQRAYYLGPNIACDINPQLRIVVGAAAGLTGESDGLALRTIAEYEW